MKTNTKYVVNENKGKKKMKERREGLPVNNNLTIILGLFFFNK